MSNTTVLPSAGALAATGLAPLNHAQGITFAIDGTLRANLGNKTSNCALNVHTISHAFTTPELQLNCVTAIGYLPTNVTIVAFEVRSGVLDSGTPAIVQSILIGSTVVATGITAGQAGVSAMVPCLPTALTAPTQVHMKTTTSPDVAAAETVYLTAWYYSS